MKICNKIPPPSTPPSTPPKKSYLEAAVGEPMSQQEKDQRMLSEGRAGTGYLDAIRNSATGGPSTSPVITGPSKPGSEQKNEFEKTLRLLEGRVELLKNNPFVTQQEKDDLFEDLRELLASAKEVPPKQVKSVSSRLKKVIENFKLASRSSMAQQQPPADKTRQPAARQPEESSRFAEKGGVYEVSNEEVLTFHEESITRAPKKEEAKQPSAPGKTPWWKSPKGIAAFIGTLVTGVAATDHVLGGKGREALAEGGSRALDATGDALRAFPDQFSQGVQRARDANEAAMRSGADAYFGGIGPVLGAGVEAASVGIEKFVNGSIQRFEDLGGKEVRDYLQSVEYREKMTNLGTFLETKSGQAWEGVKENYQAYHEAQMSALKTEQELKQQEIDDLQAKGEAFKESLIALGQGFKKSMADFTEALKGSPINYDEPFSNSIDSTAVEKAKESLIELKMRGYTRTDVIEFFGNGFSNRTVDQDTFLKAKAVMELVDEELIP